MTSEEIFDAIDEALPFLETAGALKLRARLIEARATIKRFNEREARAAVQKIIRQSAEMSGGVWWED